MSLWRIFLTQNQIINRINIFFCAALRGLPLPVSLLTVPVSLNFISSLLMLLFVAICLEIHSLTPSLYIPSTDNFFYQYLIFVAANHIYKHCGDVCNDVILMPQFLEVVRQHTLGVAVML